MLKGIIVSGFLVFILVIAGFFLIKRGVGDLRPAVLPPSENLAETIEKQEVGEPVEIPLKIADGFKVGVFAKNLGAARDVQFSPEGTLLLSITGQGKVVALPDKNESSPSQNTGSASFSPHSESKNKDGKADEVREILTGLDRPHGLAFYQDKLFIAEETRVVRYIWNENGLSASFDKELFKLPSGGRHFTRSLAVDKDGKLFVSIGSTCDTCFEKNEWLAAVVVSDIDGNGPRLFAKGLRNSVFVTINSVTNELWGTEMGRDFLGDNLPPDEINILKDGKNYGWPICYGNKVHDQRFNHEHASNECDNTESPIYEIAAHSAPLGLTFINSPQFPEEWQGDLLVAYHGSWNRSSPIGYKVVRMNVEGDKILGEEDFISGFLQGSSTLGRPVDLTFDKEGSLFISDDKIGVVYKVSKK